MMTMICILMRISRQQYYHNLDTDYFLYSPDRPFASPARPFQPLRRRMIPDRLPCSPQNKNRLCSSSLVHVRSMIETDSRMIGSSSTDKRGDNTKNKCNAEVAKLGIIRNSIMRRKDPFSPDTKYTPLLSRFRYLVSSRNPYVGCRCSTFSKHPQQNTPCSKFQEPRKA